MITENEYLNAKEIVKKYKLQLKSKKEKYIPKIDLILRNMNNKEITELFSFEFLEAEFFRYSTMINIIQKVYFNKFNKDGRGWCWHWQYIFIYTDTNELFGFEYDFEDRFVGKIKINE